MLAATSTRLDTSYRQRLGWVAFGLGIVLIVGWAIAIIVSWNHILSSHARLGYLIGDVGLVAPLCFATWYGVTRQKSWGPLLFLLLDGAIAYDVVHFGIYLMQEGFLSIPVPIYIIVLLAILALQAVLARREIAI